MALAAGVDFAVAAPAPGSGMAPEERGAVGVRANGIPGEAVSPLELPSGGDVPSGLPAPVGEGPLLGSGMTARDPDGRSAADGMGMLATRVDSPSQGDGLAGGSCDTGGASEVGSGMAAAVASS